VKAAMEHFKPINLFETPPFKLETLVYQLKVSLNRAVSASKLSRLEILDKANKLALESNINLTKGNGDLSIDMFSKWLNPNEPMYKPSIEALSILYYVLGNDLTIVEPFMRALGLDVINSEDKYYRDLGRIQSEVKRLKRQQRALEAKNEN
jgi:hypothetical protein